MSIASYAGMPYSTNALQVLMIIDDLDDRREWATDLKRDRTGGCFSIIIIPNTSLAGGSMISPSLAARSITKPTANSELTVGCFSLLRPLPSDRWRDDRK